MKKTRKQRIVAKKREVESRGGLVGISPNAPDWLTERFLDEVLECPDCQAGDRSKPVRSH